MADISSLGIGSGVLTADVIDQLKEADKSVIIKPIENKITINNQKQDATKLLTSLMKSFKASASALSFSTIFDNKTVDVDGKAKVTVDAGANVKSFTLETTTLAKKDITQFGSFGSKTDKIADGEGTFTIANGDGKSFDITYNADTTLSSLAQSITDEAGGTVDASILQTGDGEYSLVLTSKDTGEKQELTFSDSGNIKDQFKPYEYSDDGDDTNDNTAGYKNIQKASDSEFKYNGITMTRSTNEVSDLILGVNISLQEEGDISKVDINTDTKNITDEMQLFTDSYNTLMSNIHDMTLKDKETGAEGVFNGDSFVKSIKRELMQTITSVKDGDSLMNYGISIDRYGTMSFDKSVVESKMQDDQDAVKKFFTSSYDDDGNKSVGIFENIDEKLKSYTGYGKLLSTFEDGVKTEGKNLEKRYSAAQASLDTRYAIMTKRFTAYDSMISRTNSMFSSLQMMIDQASK
jgi:flagellar hook-associated protein 2